MARAALDNQIAATNWEFQNGIPMGISNPLTGQNIPMPTYLTPAEGRRVFALSAMRLLYAGRHRDYFFTENRTQHEFKAAGQVATRILYITENLAGRCSVKYADLLFGEELSVEPTDDAPALDLAVDRLEEGSSFHAELYEAAVIGSWSGSAFLQFYVAGGQVKVENVQPENIFPHYTPGTKKLQSATIKFLINIGDERFVRVIDHQVGKITQKLYRVKDDGTLGTEADLKVLNEPGLLPEQATGIDELTVVEIPNFTTGGVGISDYDGTESLIDEINNRRSQISRVLDIHGDPAMMVLASLFDEKTGNFRISGRAISVEDMTKGDPVKYLTWQAQLTEAASALVSATSAFLGQMEMAPALVGLGGGTSADSWKKFKLQATQTLSRVKRKKLFMVPAIKTLCRVFFKLENAQTLWSYPVGPISLTFSDGLPVDDLEQSQIVTNYYTARLMSRHMALTWIHGDQKIVEQEEEQLDTEAAATLPTGIDDPAGHVHETVPTADAQVQETPSEDAPPQSAFILGPGQDPPLRNPNPTAPSGAWPLA